MTRSAAWLLFLLCPLAFSSQAEEVTLDTGTGILHGTLEIPPATTAIPVVLLISGSGPTDRDGNSFLLPGRNDSLKLLAESLASLGIGTLRYD